MSNDRRPDVLIVGAGIGGLALALALHQKGIRCRIFESVAEIKPLGAGINLLPHAMRELASLGLQEALLAKGSETRELRFYTRFGHLVHSEPRGRFAGYDWPQVSIHRADLHQVLLDAVLDRLGQDAVAFGRRCVGVRQDEACATLDLVDDLNGGAQISVQGAIAVACDGVHSQIRRQFHPVEAVPRFEGTTLYRGTTLWKPFLSGATMFYLGTLDTGLLVVYPIRGRLDAQGRQLINWVAEIRQPASAERDWNRLTTVDSFIGRFEACCFDWLDIPSMLRAAEVVLEYPMIDQEPLPFWGTGRVTLLGDAAHPMMPRGSNGAAQALIDAQLLAGLLAATWEASEPRAALREYERQRLPATARVVLANRGIGPSAMLDMIEERCGGKPFDRIEDVIPTQELEQWQERYRAAAGFQREALR